MQTIWFTSDTHFFHKRILELGRGRAYNNTPITDVNEMNEQLVTNWNARVGRGDLVYHLGDVSFGSVTATIEILNRLRGQIYIVKGNHDNDAMMKKVKENVSNVVSVEKYREIKVGDRKLILFHFPILAWHQNHRGAWHLHGHCHGNLSFDNGPMLDVGVDDHNLSPINFDEVEVLLKHRKPKLWDHHIEPGEKQ